MKECTAERAIPMIILGAILSLSCDSASLKKKIDELAAHRAPAAAGALLDHLCETLILGKLGGLYQGGEKRNITYAGYTAVLRLDRDGKKEAWVLTAFGPKDFKGDREKVKKEGSPR